ncbi:uncharacterized protein LOC116927132 isoform X2 [Daphnia magna]|uniref:uncharacterized protein LOC116927132 isoform X2 n=1 Tax=Daphnia magna TaxID=35525 RepID=UPI001E1BC02F|nr:uncharacterized protein LOC116927132 isoform X2 [Daphnia magna]
MKPTLFMCVIVGLILMMSSVRSTAQKVETKVLEEPGLQVAERNIVAVHRERITTVDKRNRPWCSFRFFGRCRKTAISLAVLTSSVHSAPQEDKIVFPPEIVWGQPPAIPAYGIVSFTGRQCPSGYFRDFLGKCRKSS